MEFRDIVNERYSVKKFTGEQLPEEKINELLEIIRMSISSFGLQPYKIKVVRGRKIKEKLSQFSSKREQIITCSHLLIFCADADLDCQIENYELLMREEEIPEDKIQNYLEMARDFVNGLHFEEKLSWAQRQTYIALANAVNGAKSLGIDSCLMEVFQAEKYKKVLDLSYDLFPTALVAIGIAEDKNPEKIRFSKKDIFF